MRSLELIAYRKAGEGGGFGGEGGEGGGEGGDGSEGGDGRAPPPQAQHMVPEEKSVSSKLTPHQSGLLVYPQQPSP